MSLQQSRPSMRVSNRQRLISIAAILVVIPLGYWLRTAPGMPEWIRNLLGNVAYCLLWSLVIAVIVPKLSAVRLAFAGTLLVSLIELSQLSKSGWMFELRAYQLGRLVLGSGFSWLDIGEYFGAAFINTPLLSRLTRGEPDRSRQFDG